MTLRELVWMAQARVREAWSRTSSVMALLANCHRAKKHKLFKPSDFTPGSVRRDKQQKLPSVGVEALRDVFIKEHKP